jgi:hypothetical protein
MLYLPTVFILCQTDLIHDSNPEESAYFFLWICFAPPCIAQFAVKFQTAIGNIEHFSIGPSFNFDNRHQISLLYGSNFFIRTKNFTTYILEYSLKLKNISIGNMTPSLGVKGGHVIYSDKYYKWEVASVVPFIRLCYPLNKNFEAFMDLGGAIAFEQSVERINYGEIGKYRDLLPEIKVGTYFSFKSK